MPGSKGSLSAFVSVAASQTDTSVVAAVPGLRIKVLAFIINHGDTTPSTVTFNSKGSGAGTAISPVYKFAANGGISTANSDGWFKTNVGEGLSVTTGAGSTTTVTVSYELGS
jgi:hypothetical protein